MSRLDQIAPSRRSLLLGAAAAAPLVALGATSAQALGASRDAGGLTITDEWQHPDIRSVDYRFDTHGKVQTFPPSLRVTVPPSYLENKDRRYPVLLLLHGQGGFYQNWTNDGGVVEQTEKHEVIVVMPDGGIGNFYSNTNHPLPGRQAAWETFIMTMVLPFVHENFRTDPQRMAIAGLSMGGWGALSLGQRYWGHFRSVSSYSGPADCNPNNSLDGLAVRGAIWLCPAFEAQKTPNFNLPGSTWGEWYGNLARSYNPIANLDKYKGKRIFLRTGDGDWSDFADSLRGDADLLGQLEDKVGEGFANLVENVVAPNMERFHHAALDAGLDSDFELFPGRTHEWGLWRENLAEDLPGMMRVLNA